MNGGRGVVDTITAGDLGNRSRMEAFMGDLHCVQLIPVIRCVGPG